LGEDLTNLIYSRAKISLISIIWDIWYPQVAMEKVVTKVIELTPKVKKI
jgi:hypothetical protein